LEPKQPDAQQSLNFHLDHNTNKFLNEPSAPAENRRRRVKYCGACVIKLKIALKWAAYASLCIFIYAFATEIPALSYAVGAVLGALIIRDMVRDAVRELVLEENRTLQERSFELIARVDDIDRKVSSIWNRIRAISSS
jgi:hypothetical protein